MKKKTKKSAENKFVSKKRAQEIDDTFKALKIVNDRPYYGANEYSKNFQRVSLYESSGYVFTTSSNSKG